MAIHIQKPGSRIRRAGRVGRPEDHEIKTNDGNIAFYLEEIGKTMSALTCVHLIL